MLVKISRERFQSLKGNELSWELIQPAIVEARGKPLEHKRSVYEHLTPGQKSLFSFWILYGHTRSGWLQFVLGGSYLSGYLQFLPVIRKDLGRVGALPLLEHLKSAESLYEENKEIINLVRENLEVLPDQSYARADEIEKLKLELQRIDQGLFLLVEETSQKVEEYIRARPEEFVLFTN